MKLRDYLESRNLSSKEFAKLVGISAASVDNYLAGRRTPTLKIARKIEEITHGRVRCMDLV